MILSLQKAFLFLLFLSTSLARIDENVAPAVERIALPAPACGFTANVTDVPLVIQTPGYPDGYPANLDCDWTLTAAPGYRILLDFQGSFNLPTDVLVITQSGMGFGYGNKVPATTIVSSTNALRMRFDTSNDESTSGAGFNLTATEFSFTCGFNATVTTTPTIIYSPRYPETYPNGANCVWNLMASTPGGTITIEFHDVNTEENFDALVGLENDTEVFSADGSTIPEPFNSSTSSLTLKFGSDAVGELRGFNLTAREIPSSPPSPPPRMCLDSSVEIRLSNDDLTALGVDSGDQIVVDVDLVSSTSSVDSKCIRSFGDNAFTLQLSDCNPEIVTNVDSTVFTWIIRKLHVANALVLREDACIRRTCRYRTKSLLTSTEINTELRKTIVGSVQKNTSYDLSMGVYMNAARDMPISAIDVIMVPDIVYVTVELNADPDNTNLIVQIQSCWATPSNDPDDVSQYFLIRSGCANSSDVDSDSNPITEITRNYQLTTGKFQFQSFVWNPNVEDPIFIHCQVAICNNQTDGANCDGPMCMRKRDVSSPEGDSAQLYSYGPISVYSEARPSCLKNNGGCSDICSIIDDDVTCSCLKGKKLMDDKRTCQEPSTKTNEKIIVKYEAILLAPVLLLIGVVLLIMMSYRRVTTPLLSKEIA